jgi:hypothetical protein
MKALRESRGIAVLCFQTSALEGSEGSALRPGHFIPPGKTRCPLYSSLGGPQGRSGQVWKIWPSPAFNPRTIQPVASHYTDWATGPTVNEIMWKNMFWDGQPTDGNIIRRMLFACWIPRTTDTNSEYVIFISFFSTTAGTWKLRYETFVILFNIYFVLLLVRVLD